MRPLTDAEFVCGMVLLIAGLAALAAGYCVHMYKILMGIAEQWAEERAEQLVRERLRNVRVQIRHELLIEYGEGWEKPDGYRKASPTGKSTAVQAGGTGHDGL